MNGMERAEVRGELEREWNTVRTALWAENWTAAIGAIVRALRLIEKLRKAE